MGGAGISRLVLSPLLRVDDECGNREKNAMRKIGRPRGALNRTTRDVREILQPHVATAINTLVLAMDFGAAAVDTVSLTAARDILDRVYGKPAQAVENHYRGELKIGWISSPEAARPAVQERRRTIPGPEAI